MSLRKPLPGTRAQTSPLLEACWSPVDRIGPVQPGTRTSSACDGVASRCAPAPAKTEGPVALPDWVRGELRTAAGSVPRVATRLGLRDRLGSWKARWGIGRMDFKVPPGLYGTGNPGPESPVLVTANYKMSFDCVRRALDGLNAWILVLETNGVNVWCAAGKGTFGTRELVSRIAAVKLPVVVSHRSLVVPQLGAPGIAAHDVRQQSGFTVRWGPVRAEDISAYLAAGRASEAMRIVNFTLMDRLVLTPMELTSLKDPTIKLAALLFLPQLLGWLTLKPADLWPFLGACLSGAVLAPVLLPWIPGRAFALKGWLLGLAWSLAVILVRGLELKAGSLFTASAYVLILPAMTSYLTLNFTGASTYTSLSGVIRETKAWVSPLKFSLAAGLSLWALGRFL